MANFCTRCGRRLMEGEVCSCQAGQSEKTVGQQPPEWQQFGNSGFGKSSFGYGGSFDIGEQFTTIIDLIKRPVTAGKEFIMEADIATAMILIVLQGIFNSIFVMLAGNKLSGFIKSILLMSGELSSKEQSAFDNVIKLPYFRMLIVTVLFTLGAACLFALLMFAGCRAVKIMVSFGQMLSAAAIRSAVMLPAILLCMVVFEMSSGWGILLFVLINIWGFTAAGLALHWFNGYEKQDAFVLVISIVVLLYILIVTFAISKVWTFYLPDILKEAMDEVGNMSEEDLFNELF